VNPVFFQAFQTVDASTVKSVFLRHILLLEETMVDVVLEQIRDISRWEGQDGFAEVASSISVCEETKFNHGNIGWVDRDGRDRATDALFPGEGVEELYTRGLLKPGDVHTVKTKVGFHVLQILDVQTEIRSKKAPSPKLKGGGEAKRGAKDGRSAGWEERSNDRVLHSTITNNLPLLASLLASSSSFAHPRFHVKGQQGRFDLPAAD